MNRIDQAFARLRERRETGFVAFVTAGFPSVEATLEVVPALLEGGADIIELGVPFSDPLADGATIQRASFQALQQGVTPQTCLEVVRSLRGQDVAAPLLLMGYYNPILSYGLDRFCADCTEAGVDGLIVPDLPPEEADELEAACAQRPLHLVYLLAPTSREERIAVVCQRARGFIYCVSLKGVTGARQELSSILPEFLERVRKHTELPLAVGFGISKPEHFRQIGELAEAAVIGSAIIDLLERLPADERRAGLRDFVREMKGQPTLAGAGLPME